MKQNRSPIYCSFHFIYIAARRNSVSFNREKNNMYNVFPTNLKIMYMYGDFDFWPEIVKNPWKVSKIPTKYLKGI